MHPFVIRELAQIREQEQMQAALMDRAARQARRQQHRGSVRGWLAGRLRGWSPPGSGRVEPSPALPPILHPAIRREAR